ncbi:MAG: 16S rRNA (guanine(966)-N(2))-methyltransferase RsmD [Planctomycetota bacterium]|jgi:16S rRNA (guanine966-N2)-methyltransferase|nr:16S rRNA (guanine(966)-N(2))-methyltransferase RsmD [Planctomycetota bacterium]
MKDKHSASAKSQDKMAVRILSGLYRGRSLSCPPGSIVRPLRSRVRGAIMNSIVDHLRGAILLDLFSGTGSLGLEALSRQARFCLFVEKRGEVLDLLQDNIDRCDASHRSRILPQNAYSLRLPDDAYGPFTLVFLDPPFADMESQDCVDQLTHLLTNIYSDGWITDDTLLVWHLPVSCDPHLPSSFISERVRNYGESQIRFLSMKPPEL